MRILVALTALLMSSAAAFADTMEDCRRADPARSVDACSLILQAKDATKATQVEALGLRAYTYMRKNELDKAMADLKRALDLDPKTCSPFPRGARCTYAQAVSIAPWRT
jgi:cytochrome c-type biogenesis protein CcmH/NrfG